MCDTDDALLSRTGVQSPIGSLIEELKTKVDPDTAEQFRRVCRAHGTNPAEALRNYVCKIVHGRSFDELAREQEQRRRLAMHTEGLDGGLIPLRVVEQPAQPEKQEQAA